MVEYEKRAPINQQRERVFEKRDEILNLLKGASSLQAIKDRVGLSDMPYGTYYRHVAKLRDGSKSSELLRRNISEDIPLAAKPEAAEKFERHDPQNEAAVAPKATQPKAVEEKKTDKIPPKKRKFVQVEVNKADENDPGFVPSKWKDTEI